MKYTIQKENVHLTVVVMGLLPKSNYVGTYIPDDSTLCLENPVQFGEERIAGSVIVHCEGNKRISKIYSDTKCTEQDPKLQWNEFIVDGCQEPQLLFDDEEEPIPQPQRFKSDCGKKNAHQYYCKDLTTVGIGIKVDSPKLMESAAPVGPQMKTAMLLLLQSIVTGSIGLYHILFLH